MVELLVVSKAVSMDSKWAECLAARMVALRAEWMVELMAVTMVGSLAELMVAKRAEQRVASTVA
jgi:hypothetical protein